MNSNVGISEVFCFVFSKKYRCRRLSVRYLPVIVYLFSGKPPEIPGYHTREHSPGGQPENTRRAQYRGEQGNHARGTPGDPGRYFSGQSGKGVVSYLVFEKQFFCFRTP